MQSCMHACPAAHAPEPLPGSAWQVTHMPPELLSEGRLSKAADVYSFGVMLWEMCATLPLHTPVRESVPQHDLDSNPIGGLSDAQTES